MIIHHTIYLSRLAMMHPSSTFTFPLSSTSSQKHDLNWLVIFLAYLLSLYSFLKKCCWCWKKKKTWLFYIILEEEEWLIIKARDDDKNKNTRTLPMTCIPLVNISSSDRKKHIQSFSWKTIIYGCKHAHFLLRFGSKTL